MQNGEVTINHMPKVFDSSSTRLTLSPLVLGNFTTLIQAVRDTEDSLGLIRINRSTINSATAYPVTVDDTTSRAAKLMIGAVQDVLSVLTQLRTQENISLLWGRMLKEPVALLTPAILASRYRTPFSYIQEITQMEGKQAINIWYTDLLHGNQIPSDLIRRISLAEVKELENYLRRYADEITSYSKAPVPLQISRGYHTASGFTWNLAYAIITAHRAQSGKIIGLDEFSRIWANTWQDLVACATTNQLIFTALLSIIFEPKEEMTLKNNIVDLVEIDGVTRLGFRVEALSSLKITARELNAHKRKITNCPALQVNSDLGQSGVHYLFKDIERIATTLLIPCLTLHWHVEE